MELPEWEGYSFDLAWALTNNASRDLANSNMTLERKMRAMKLTLGFRWAKKAIRAVGAAEISGLSQRAMRLNCTKDLAQEWRAWPHKLWFAPPELAAEQPHKWWTLIATKGLGGRASEEQWAKLFEELNDILIFSPTDLAELGKDQLHVVSDDPDSNRLLGRLRRAAKVAGGSKDLTERPCPSAYVLQGWNAHQLARAISADSAKDSELGRAFSSQEAELGLSPDDCDRMGTMEKMRKVAENATSTEQISLFSQAGAQLNPHTELRRQP